MANTDFGILLKTLLDKSGINSELEQVQKIVNKYTIDIMPELKTASLKNQMKAVSQEIANDFNKAFGTNLTGNDVFKAFENQAKQAEKAVKEETKAIEAARKEQESLTNAMAKGREQAELSRQTEQKRQQMAQNNAINKALEQEYQERQKNIEAARKQAELDKQNALAFTKSASERLSSAISKYSYGDTSDANAMMKQMNRGLSNFGDLSNVQGNITQLSSTVDKIIADLKLSHEQSLQALNEEIKAEQTLQSQKDTFNKKNINAIDYEIQKREEEAKAFSSMLQAQMQEQQKMQSEVNKIQLSTDITKIENDYKRFGIVSQEVENNLKELKIARENALKAEGTDRASAEIEKYNQKLAETKSSWKELQATQVSMNQRTSQMTTMQEWMRKNQKATKLCGVEVEKLIQECLTCNKVRFDQIKNEFKALQVEAGKAGKLGNTLFGGIIEQGKKFIQWSGVTGAVMTVSNKVREAVDELKDLDDILTEISKTSDLTEQQLKKLGDTAFDTASKYGKKASDYLTGVQEMYRAGFDNASEMAELSVLAQSAGDMDTTIANDYILATNAAYKYKGSVEELNKVLDSQNYITNNAAISMKDIADATTETASVAAQYGVEIDELSALIATATANTRESGSEVGTALKAILINLQDTTSKPVTDTFDALGISMTKVVNGAETLKTPIELIHELADAYNSLPEGDIMRANILNEIGQKRHANTLAAVLSDMKSYNKMLELYNSSLADDSAYREAEKSANNLSGSLNKLRNTWTDIVDNILNSYTLTTGVNVLNDLLGMVNKLTDALGGLGTVGLASGLFAGIKNVGIDMLVAC